MIRSIASRLCELENRVILENKYGDLGEIQSQTLADGEKLFDTGYDIDHVIVSLKLTLPNGYTILWQRTGNGFVCYMPKPSANTGAGGSCTRF